MGAREGVDPENLEGLKISGGPTGDRNVTVAKNILEEMGIDPDDLEFVPSSPAVPTSGSRHCWPGRSMSPNCSRATWPSSRRAAARCSTRSSREVPQEVWVVREDTLEEDHEAVCGYLKGRIAGVPVRSRGRDLHRQPATRSSS